MKIPHIKDAFASIQNACLAKITKIYPHGIPSLVQERLDKELAFLKNSTHVDDFEIYRQISMEVEKCCQYFTIRGTLSGSYLAYLMGNGRFNPLPAHYYCPKCGHFETITTHLPGIDLPEKACPVCGEILLGDGFNLPIESVWGLDGQKLLSFDYNVCEEFRPFIRKVLMKLYPENQIVPCGMMSVSSGNLAAHTDIMEVLPCGFIILPTGHTMVDYPELQTYFENGDPCLSVDLPYLEKYSMKRVCLLSHNTMEQLLALQRATGTYITEISIKELRELTYHDFVNSRTLDTPLIYLVENRKPKTYHEIMQYICMLHNSFHDRPSSSTSFIDDITKYIFDTPEYQAYPCASREDFFDFLKESGLTTEDAFTLSELIRKGRFARDPKLDTSKLPPALSVLAKKFLYLFPRAHVTEYTLLYARMAYYMKLDSKVYSKLVFKNLKLRLPK